MVKRTGPTDAYLQQLIARLKTSKVAIWSDVAEKLEKPRRIRVEVNVSDIDRNANDKKNIVVPGIVLAAGEITKPVTVAAWRFSREAEEKIKNAKGKCITIEELMKQSPKGSNVRILV